MIEENEETRKGMIRMMEENEDNRKMIESMSEGSDVDMEQMLQNYRTAGQDVLGWDQEQVETLERGLREGVKTRGNRNSKSNGSRQSKGETQNRNKASKASKCVSAKNNSWGRRERKTQAN